MASRLESASHLPFAFARSHGVLLAARDEREARLLVRRNASLEAISEIRRVLGVALAVEVIDEEDFARRLSETYAQGESGERLALELEQDIDLSRLAQELPRIEELLDADDDAPIIRVINALFMRALKEGASDMHIEPFEARSVTRFRIDGMLRDVFDTSRALHAAMVSRIKIMASLDIAEKRLPQDGRITLKLAGKPVDVRVSTLPTGHGERVVLRLLDKEAGRLDLTRLGMGSTTLEEFRALIRQPHGIILVTGPTGSGKTTTLYAALEQIDTTTLNVMTVEDPIEYLIHGIGQTQVNARIDLSFAKALRAILRQDPDVIMIGEIRDLETAQIAIQASLTGHLVLATLHTNDAVSSVTRLLDMGIEPFLLASSLIGVVAQRLARRLCPFCRRPAAADASEAALFNGQGAPAVIHHAGACPACNQTGYRGRSGIYELLRLDDGLRQLIHAGAGEQALRERALQQGMKTLRQDGMRWVAAGETTVEEILRVTRE
ncbi:MAG: type II secretion system ATPase GspE [Betaproteobacteria bacterium]|nr:type II secretion system ATPase GspE [Betaproteobacteria bacterium]